MATTQNIVDELRSQGHEVETYTRTRIVTVDGESKRVADAIRIVRIDGRIFPKSGAEGNRAAREMTGRYLSKFMITQRRKARGSIKKMALTKAQKILLKQLRKDQKKKGESLEKSKHIKRLRKREGAKATTKALKNKIIHERHYAYYANIEWFLLDIPVDQMPKTMKALGQKEGFNPAIDEIRPSKTWAHLTDEALKEMHDLVYKAANKTITWEECDKECAKIVNGMVQKNPSFSDFTRPRSHHKAIKGK